MTRLRLDAFYMLGLRFRSIDYYDTDRCML